MLFDRKHLTDEQLLNMYRSILLPRMVEEKMLVLLRQGKISKWFSGIGQEAISVGATPSAIDSCGPRCEIMPQILCSWEPK